MPARRGLAAHSTDATLQGLEASVSVSSHPKRQPGLVLRSGSSHLGSAWLQDKGAGLRRGTAAAQVSGSPHVALETELRCTLSTRTLGWQAGRILTGGGQQGEPGQSGQRLGRRGEQGGLPEGGSARTGMRRAGPQWGGPCAAAVGPCNPRGLTWALPLPGPPAPGSFSRLAEKKASIGYTYEDSTVAEVEKAAEKPEEEESPAEEESNSDEDEVIPDIGGVPSLPSPPAVPGHRFCVSFLTLWGTRAYKASPLREGLGLLLLPAFPALSCLSCPRCGGHPLSPFLGT